MILHPPALRHRFPVLFLFWLLFLPGTALAEHILTLGVFAYRSKPVMMELHQPLADYLGSRLADTRVRLVVLDPTEMTAALARKDVDFLMTNPSHYTDLRYHDRLAGVLATVIRRENGITTTQLGGVIISPAGRADLSHIAHLRGKRIAAPGGSFLGGFRAQALIFQEAGIDLPDDARMIETGSHDAVIEAVLAGQADAGFIRTGLLETRYAEGTLAAGRLQVVHPRREPGFPYQLSTYLYPEWPFVALPHVDMHTVQHVAAALFSLDADHPAAQAAGIAGFAPPLDYLPVENLARTLRLSPFDHDPEFSLADVARKYWPALLAACVSLAVILLLTSALIRRNRLLHQALQASETADARVRASEALLRKLFELLPVGMILTDRHGRIVDSNPSSEHILGLTQAEQRARQCGGEEWVARRPDGSLIPRDQHPGVLALAEGRAIHDVEMALDSPRGQIWLNVSAIPFEHARYALLVTFLDITERKRDEATLRQAAGVFEHAREGILITDRDANILDVNRAFTRITGYEREEMLGSNPRLLASGRQPRDFYVAMWQALMEDGFWSGEIWNRRKNGEIYAELQTISAVRDARGSVLRYIALFSDITAIKEHEKQLEDIAHYDALTRLPNRILLADRMKLAMAHGKRSGEMLAVCIMDLDGFKPVNDSLGHKAGDQLLREIAHRLQETIRADDTAARVGGDEFALLLGGFANAEQCEQTLRRLLVAIAQPVVIEGKPVRVTASLGVTFYQGDGTDADQLLRHADQAMYTAKEKGKNRYHIFDTAVELRLRANQELYRRIASALERGQFALHYQPKVDCRSGRVIGLEALIRWNHPVLGLRGPSEFIPLIEEDDMVIRLGEWVIDEALRQMADWQADGIDLPVSVNVTVRQILGRDFASHLSGALKRYPPEMARRLELELVETAALDDIHAVSEAMRAPQGQGVHFALDDFGTGYSSLVHLKRLTVDTLKIDQSFVHDMVDDTGDLAIVQGVIGLATAFHHEVVAEGVETTEHILMLLELGCDVMQGFGIARPMPAAAVPDWLRNFRADPRWLAASSQFPSRGDFDLLLMEVMHRHWLERWRTGGLSPGERPAPDYEACRLGQWCQDIGQPRYGHLPEFQAVDRQHRELHRLASALLDAYSKQDADAIPPALSAVEAASAALLGLMHALRITLVANSPAPSVKKKETTP